MTIFESARRDRANRMLSVLRIVAAMLVIGQGTQKLFGFPAGGTGPIVVHLTSQAGLTAILETFGGLAILLGLFTRPVALVLAAEMAVAYLRADWPRGFYPIANQGETAVLFCFVYLYLTFAGAGAWSLDHRIASARGSRAHRVVVPRDQFIAASVKARVER